MPKKVIIIGAGIGGLSAGCYAQMNGYRVHIFEKHYAPGGLCTSWSRHGFTFDGCIHNLAGTAPDSPFATMWRELGITARMHAFKEMIAIEAPRGDAPLTMLTKLEDLEAALIRQFPTDEAEIRRLIKAARKMSAADLLGLALAPLFERVRAIMVLASLSSIGRMTLEQYAQRFSDPRLRATFPRIIYDWPRQSMFMALHFLAGLHKGDLGWPMGGSGAFARSIAERLRQLGGEITYNAVVSEVTVENDRAVGVRLQDGRQHRADIVISNAYGPTTVLDMIPAKYAPAALRRRYRKPEDRIEMGIHVSFGVKRTLTEESHAIVFPLETPVEIDGEMRDRLFIQTFGHDPAMAPPGKGVIKVLLPASWARWKELSLSPRRYHEEQDRIAAKVLGVLESRFPGISADVEVTDVATPITTRRFTGVGPGFGFSIGEFLGGILLGQNAGRTLPGLKNFYMVGQWAGAPGVPMVAAMGRELVREICKRDGRRFVALPPSPAPAASAWRGAA
jgi:phytoene dehydrogenase-like protein